MLARIATLATIALMLGGCGATLPTVLTNPPSKSQGYFHKCLADKWGDPGVGDAAGVSFAHVMTKFKTGLMPEQTSDTVPMGPGAIHEFLDCYIGPVHQNDLEGRILRGHIIVVLLAQYGAETLEASSRSAKPEDAQRMLAHIRRAQRHLLAASPAGLDARWGQSANGRWQALDGLKGAKERAEERRIVMGADGELPFFRNAQRHSAVFEVGIDISRVNAREFLYVVKSLFSAVVGRSVPDLSVAIGYALDGLNLASKVEWYGGAFIRDAQLTLGQLRAAGVPAAEDNVTSSEYQRAVGKWQAWNVRLQKACESLQAMAKTDLEGCWPSKEYMKGYLESEYQWRHPGSSALK